MPKPPHPFRPQGLGEVAIRCRNLAAMVGFYRDVIGLTLIEGNYPPHIAFLHVAAGFHGHTTVIALFADAKSDGAPGALHHLALTLSPGDQDAAIAWFAATGRECRIELHGWIGWRGVYVTDPEGNEVELVAADPSFRTG